jgi:hypothetical protein
MGWATFWATFLQTRLVTLLLWVASSSLAHGLPKCQTSRGAGAVGLDIQFRPKILTKKKSTLPTLLLRLCASHPIVYFSRETLIFITHFFP